MECKSCCDYYFTIKGKPELIDTLWNVNSEKEIKKRFVKRINRYIMECKFTATIRRIASSEN